MNSNNIKYIVSTLIISLSYFLSAKIVTPLSLSQSSSVFILWPPTGIALASFILFGKRSLVGVFIGAFLLNITITPLLVSLQIAFTNALGPLLGFYLIKKYIPDFRIFNNNINILYFILSITLSSLITSFFGTFALSIHNIIPNEIFLNILFSWFNGDLIGFLILTPFIISLYSIKKTKINIKVLIELIFVSSLLLIITWFLFRDIEIKYSIEMLLILPLLWFTIRFGILGSTFSLILLSILLTLGTIKGTGPFIREDLDITLFILQNYIVVLTITLFLILVMLNKNKTKTLEIEKLANKLLVSQKIAKLANWELNTKTMEVHLSDHFSEIIYFNKKITDNRLTFFKSIMNEKDWNIFHSSLINTLKTGEEHNFTFKVDSKDSKILWINSKGELDNKTMIINATIQDITESKLAEIEKEEKDKLIFQQSKMATIGEMISNIAHQWRQPLNLISTISSGIKIQKDMNMLKDEEINKSMDKIIDSTQYLSSTIDDFRNFFNPNKEKNHSNIKVIIEKTLNLVSSQLNNNDIKIITNIQSIELYTYKNELIQVLINIINNASDELTKNDDPKLIFLNAKKINTNIEISIKDNAGGIPKNIINRILEPYFTTKNKSQGTGIGLYMCEEIIVKHLNGSITIENVNYKYNREEMLGAEFKITMPINESVKLTV